MLFKLLNVDNDSTELTTAEDELNGMLKLSVPGLVSESRRPVGRAGTDGNAHVDVSATGHKLLIEPSVFNMGYLLRPSLNFIRRLADIVPLGYAPRNSVCRSTPNVSSSNIASSSLTSFLDEFLVNVFQPQLDETLTEFSAHIFIELDAFQVDPQWAKVAKRPVFKVCPASGSRVGEILTVCRAPRHSLA